MIKIFTDAATKGNPGPTGLGIIIIANHKQIQLAIPVDKERMDNHHGEFAAAHFGFKYLIDHFPTVVTQWIPESQNRGAHNLANQALHKIE